MSALGLLGIDLDRLNCAAQHRRDRMQRHHRIKPWFGCF